MNLSDRMKLYERQSSQAMTPLLPVCARIDGRAFSSYTRKLRRPYDLTLSRIMIATMAHLVEETCAVVGYTQSDEISLVFYSSDFRSQIFFNGKHQKMVSILASMATAKFNGLADYENIEYRNLVSGPALFDCRVWTVPTLREAANYLIWREQDATRNSIQSGARSFFSHKQCDKKNTSEMIDMMASKNWDWNDYPVFFKRGTFARRRKVKRLLELDELLAIPEKHRPHPSAEVERTEVQTLCLPKLTTIDNLVAVLFSGDGRVETKVKEETRE